MSIKIDKRVNKVKGGWLVFNRALYRLQDPPLIQEHSRIRTLHLWLPLIAFILFLLFVGVCR